MKNIRILAALTAMAAALSLASCSGNTKINLVSREEGSGTRGAFVELLGVEDGSGNDATAASAEITNSTAVMLSTVAGNKNAIGYVSLGSLSSDVKAISVDGAAPTVVNIKSGAYKVARPFNVVYKEGSLSVQAKDFLNFIMSAEGQKILTGAGCIAQENAPAYTASGVSGKITLSGSTSVSPAMEKLAEAYKKLNAGVEIDIQQTGSGAGITAATDGIVDLGMSSRDLKSEEAEKLTCLTIATDGIAVIVHPDNPLTNLSSDQIRSVFLGETTDWSELR